MACSFPLDRQQASTLKTSSDSAPSLHAHDTPLDHSDHSTPNSNVLAKHSLRPSKPDVSELIEGLLPFSLPFHKVFFLLSGSLNHKDGDLFNFWGYPSWQRCLFFSLCYFTSPQPVPLRTLKLSKWI